MAKNITTVVNCVGLSALCLSAALHAETTIGIDFIGRSGNGVKQSPMGANESAGVIPRTHWNSVADLDGGVNGGTVGSLQDQAGNNTGASVTWATSDAWRTDSGTNAPGNQRMMLGYINAQLFNSVSVDVNGLPASFATTPYDVFVYLGTDFGGNYSDYALTAGATALTVRGSWLDPTVTPAGGFIKANGCNTAPGGNGLIGNYLIFNQVTGTSFSISTQAASERAGFCGIQIVQRDTTQSPIAATGWNADVILEDAAGASAVQFGIGAYVGAWFEARQGANADGLPRGGAFYSENDPGTKYQLQPYGANNCLLLPAGGSGSLTLTTPAFLKTLRILAAATGASPATTGTYRFHFTDNTTSAAFTFNSPDWGNNSPVNGAMTRLGRSSTAGSTFTYLRDVDYNLYGTQATPNTVKKVDRIDFTAATGIGNTGIFALSGTVNTSSVIVQTITPASGVSAGGTPVTVTGIGFLPGASVTFGGVAATSVVVGNSSTLTCVTPPSSPAGALGPVDVKVTNTDLSTDTKPAGYMYTNGVAPTITSITPNSGQYDLPSPVTIKGTGFAPNLTAAGVALGGQPISNAGFQVVNSQTINCTLPSYPSDAIGITLDVVVTNPDGLSSAVNNNDKFTFTGFRAPENDTGLGNRLFYNYFRTKANNASPVTDLLPNPAAPRLDLQPHNPIVDVNQGAYPQFQSGFVDQMRFDGFNPFDNLQANNFYIEYNGMLNVPATGVWTFSTASDDGSRLWIGSTLVVDNNFSQPLTERSGTVALQAGLHRFRVHYAEGLGAYGLIVSWQGPGTLKQEIPQGDLGVTQPGFYGEGELIVDHTTIHALNTAGGQAVTLKGGNFGSWITDLTVQGTSVAFTVIDDTTIQFTSPPSASSGPAALTLASVAGQSVTLAGGLPNGLVYQGGALTLGTISPAGGSSSGNLANNPVTITAANATTFTSTGVTVTIGGTTVPATTAAGAKSVTFIPPAHALGTVNVSVINGDAQPATNTLAQAYTYNAPTIGAINPNSGVSNGGTLVTIAGTNFGPGTTVKFGALAADNVVIDAATTITCVSPPSPGSANGPVNVTVENVGGAAVGGAAVAVNGFTYANRPPDFPNSNGKIPGVQTKFYLNGSGIISMAGPGVMDGLEPFLAKVIATNAMAGPTPGTILSLVPAGSTRFYAQITGYVKITAAGTYTFFTASNDGTLLYVGDTLVVSNNNVQPVTERSGAINLAPGLHRFTLLYGQDQDVYGLSASMRGPDTGNAKIIIPDSVLFTEPAPSVTSITPATGSIYGNTPVSIAGSGFAAGARVFIGGVAASGVTVASSTALTAKAPGGTLGISANVVVVNSNGSAETLLNGYTFITSPRGPDAAVTTEGTFFRYYTGMGDGTVPSFVGLTPLRIGGRPGEFPAIISPNTVTYPFTQNDFHHMQISGYISVPYSGTWTFYTASDDGSVLFIGNTQVVYNNIPQPLTTRAGTIPLLQGIHAFTLQFSQGQGDFGLYLGWGCDDAPGTIPLDPQGTDHGGPPSNSNLIPANAFSYIPPTWVGNGGNSNWSTPLNWNCGPGVEPSAPVQSDTIALPQEALVTRFGSAASVKPFIVNNDSSNPTLVYVMELNSDVPGNAIGGNRLEFTGSNPLQPYGTYTGPNLVQNGSGSVAISASIFIRDSLTLNGIGTGIVTFSGALAGAGTGSNLIKTGTTTVSLTGDVSGFSSRIVLNGGVLGINTTITPDQSPSAVGISPGAMLRGTGTVNANVLVIGTVFPGDVASTLTNQQLSNLTLGSADFANGGTYQARVFAPNATTVTADKLTVPGSLTLGGASTLALHVQAANGTYANKDALIVDAGPGNTLATAFNTVTVSGSPGGPVINALQVLYVDSSFTPGGAAGIQGVYNNSTGVTTYSGASYNRIFVRLNGSVTPVTVDSLSAKAEGAGALIEWKLASEYQNLGFNLYRRAVGCDRWEKTNAAMLPGRITDPSSHTYRFYDWAQPGVYDYRLESISVAGVGDFYTKLAGPVLHGADFVAMTVDALDAAMIELGNELAARKGAGLSRQFITQAIEAKTPAASSVPLLAVGADGKPLSSATVRQIAAAAPRSAADARNLPAESGLGVPGVLPRLIPRPVSGGVRNVAKVVYGNSGVLLVPKPALPPGFNINKLTIQREGRALSALAVTPDGLLLYGPGYQDEYTARDAFFLAPSARATPAGAPASAHGLFDAGKPARTASAATVTAQFRDVYFDWKLRPYDYPPYFSSHYLTQNGTASFTMNASSVGAGSAVLTVNAWSLTSTAGVAIDHAVQAFVNGTPVGQATWSGGGRFVGISFQVPPGVLLDGNNAIELVTPELPEVSQQIALVHSMSLDYSMNLAGPGPLELTHTEKFSQLYEVSRLDSANLWVVDARFADRAALVPYQTQAQGDGTYRARFTAQPGGTGKCLVVPAGRENKPLAVSKRTLKPAPAGVQYLAAGPSQFSAPLQALLMQRRKEGLKGAFADQEQLFDYYNYGRYGPEGIRNAVRSVRAQYLLLAGRTTADYRDFTGASVDPLCPTFLIATSFWSQATSDALFGDLGRGYPEVRVGRIPANNAAECATAVKHILAYKGPPGSGWRAQMTADAADPFAGDFAAEADMIVAANPSIAWTRNYLGITAQSSGDAATALRDAANGGADLLLYNGHGSATHLGADEPHILDTDSVQAWNGNVVFIAATCTFNWVAKDEQGYRSIPIQALVQPQGGIAASIGTSTYMNSHTAVQFAHQLLSQAQSLGAGARWGDVLLRTQQWASAQSRGNAADGAWFADLSRTESILGDPAMPVYSRRGREP